MSYIQPDFRIPITNAAVGVQPLAATLGNPLSLAWPLPRYVDPVSTKDDPQGTIKAGKSGKGSAG